MAQNKHRNWCFTLNNYTPDEWNQLTNYQEFNLNIKMLIATMEVGCNGTPHIQGYVEVIGPVTLDTLKRQLSPMQRAHLESRYGTREQAISYTLKELPPLSEDLGEEPSSYINANIPAPELLTYGCMIWKKDLEWNMTRIRDLGKINTIKQINHYIKLIYNSL